MARGSWLVAPVLGAAGIAKLVSNSPVTASSLSDRVPSYLFELMPWFEIGLALWLISRRAKFGSWLIATVLFALFSIHAGQLTAQQQSSCGCLGSVTVPPIITLAIDLALLTLLVLGWPKWQGWPEVGATGRTILTSATIAAVLLGGVLGWAHFEFGSVEAAVSIARGDPVTLEQNTIHLGRVPASSSSVSRLRVRNNTDDEIQIAMAATGCSCATVQDLPVNIRPHSTADVSILITVSPEAGEFRRAVRLTTSAGALSYTIGAVVVPSPSENLP